MKMKLIAAAITGMLAAPAFAQVTIYGSVDALFETFSNDNASTTMDDATHKTSRLGFQGSEDLGGGMKAFFQLEERFQLDTSTRDDHLRFKDKAWVGLSGGFGSVSFGRVPTALDIIYGGGKAANVDTIADWGGRKAQSDGRVDNGISYTSPKLGPVTIYAHTALTEGRNIGTGAGTSAPTPWGISFNATFGPAFVESGFQKDSVGNSTSPAVTCSSLAAVPGTPSCSYNEAAAANSTSNLYKTFLLNGGYKFGTMSVYAAWARSKGYQKGGFGVDPDTKRTVYALGLDAKVGANGAVYATLGQRKDVNAAGVEQPKYTKLGVAYVHSLSKRTQLIGALSYEKQDAQFAGEDKRVGVQAGVRHGF